jgi:hypothetical protein
MMMMLLSLPILTKAFGAKGACAAGAPASATARRVDPVHSKPMVKALTVAAPAPFKKERRDEGKF